MILPDSKMDPIVVCRDVEVSFPGRIGPAQTVLQSLDLEIATGTILTLLGPSGCGKSTLLRVIAGLISPQTGVVEVMGKTYGNSHDTSMKHLMSFVFQEASLLPWRSVMQNVLLPLELRGALTSSECKERCEHWLDAVGLKRSDWDKRPRELSGGMKMRASIARAMTTQPRLLLMDEPFAALDDVLRSRLNDLLLQIAASESCTVVFVTHNIGEAIYLSDLIAIMDRGSIPNTISVGFAESRTAALRSSVEFSKYYGQVSDVLFRSASRLEEAS
jgi:NitT/TauT family transport system ATP-binding protein